jgi:hypothetical protein
MKGQLIISQHDLTLIFEELEFTNMRHKTDSHPKRKINISNSENGVDKEANVQNLILIEK